MNNMMATHKTTKKAADIGLAGWAWHKTKPPRGH